LGHWRTDKDLPNFQLIDDDAVWLVNPMVALGAEQFHLTAGGFCRGLKVS
jgi:hypothetical protein